MRPIHDDHGVSQDVLDQAIRISDGKSMIVHFHTFIGTSNVVPVSDSDEFYEKRRGDRPYNSRFVKGKEPVHTNKLAIVWKKGRLITAYPTTSDDINCPDEPGNILRKVEKGRRISVAEMERSLEFWTKHAFVEV